MVQCWPFMAKRTFSAGFLAFFAAAVVAVHAEEPPYVPGPLPPSDPTPDISHHHANDHSQTVTQRRPRSQRSGRTAQTKRFSRRDELNRKRAHRRGSAKPSRKASRQSRKRFVRSR